MAQSGKEFIGCVERYHRAKFGTVGRVFIRCVESYHPAQFVRIWKRVNRVCGKLSHGKLSQSLAEGLQGACSVTTPKNVVHSGREYIGCVENYHTEHAGRDFIGCVETYYSAQCVTVWLSVYRLFGELSQRKIWHSLAEIFYAVWRVTTPHSEAQTGREYIGYVDSYHTAHSGTV